MARTLTLSSFSTAAQTLVKGTKLLNMTISNIHGSSTPAVNVLVGGVYVIANLQLPPKTSVVLFEESPLSVDTSTVTVSTDISSTINVVYTID